MIRLTARARSLRPLEVLLVAAVPLLAAALYLPFLGNQLVFDDVGLFRGAGLAHLATTPFDFSPRTFPYFTLTAIDVITASVEVHRVVSLALHVACALLLFAFLRRLLEAVRSEEEGALGRLICPIKHKKQGRRKAPLLLRLQLRR